MPMLIFVACLCTCLDGVPAGRCEHHWESVRVCAAACGQEVDGGPVIRIHPSSRAHRRLHRRRKL